MTGLQPLAQYRQFMIYKLVPGKKAGKMDKIPVDLYSLDAVDPTNPSNWYSAQEVSDALPLLGPQFGPAFQFTDQDPFFFLDIDHCRSTNGQITQGAAELLNALQGAAVEISTSGAGLHIIGSLNDRPAHGCRYSEHGLSLELYTADRFVALTGNMLTEGSASADCTGALSHIIARYFSPRDYADAEWTSEPRADWHGPESDEELIQKALKSGNAFSNRAKFADLWRNNVDKLAECYPDSDPTRLYDYSQADAALAQHLAFWTGCDCERIKRIMMQSELVRDKWDRDDYLIRTISRAAGMQQSVLGAREPVQLVESMPAAPQLVSGHQFMAVEQQLQHFAGCVYVRDIHRALIPDGSLLKPEQFRAQYGGYIYMMDANHDKVTKNAWEAFTESQAVRFPKAAGVAFDPLRPAGAIWDQDGRTVVNSWVPVEVARTRGDASPFLRHLQLLVPNERDQQILLAYMAACVQHQGHKFQWCPLIQGTEGNGKTLFTYCVKKAIGDRYTFMPNPQTIDSNFNSWLMGRTFYGVEDIYVPEHKLMVWEALKPMITGAEGLAIEQKGVDSIQGRPVGNFMLNSNHKDAVRKTQGDRRVAPFYTAQQTPQDLRASGMDGDYFPRLYDWLKHRDGFAIVADFLWSYAIPQELNPALGAGGLMHRAPETSSTQEAIELSLGAIEQEIMEAIDQELPGFAGGWVSSHALDKLLKDLRAERKVPINRRKALMESLGYGLHPALRDGRLSIISPCDDGRRPRVYVRRDSLHCNLTAEQVAEQYIKKQGEAAARPSGAAAGAFS